MKGYRSSHILLDLHVTREFVLDFLVSFLFFFFIFFINQILLLVQQVMLKSVDVSTILTLVLCAIPQFLQYVVPFATLSASSMVLGDLGSANELLAMRSSGIPLGKVYRVLVVCSLVMSLLTFYIADYLMPASSRVYQRMLTDVMRDLPTFELREDSTNSVGDVVMRNGDVSGDAISDVMMFTTDSSPYMTILSPEGRLELVDPVDFVYRLDLEEPSFLLSEDDSVRTVLSSAGKATIYLDFSRQVPALTQSSPSNLSSAELWPLMQDRKAVRDENVAIFHDRREDAMLQLAGSIARVHSSADLAEAQSDIDYAVSTLEAIGDDEPIQFYYQYYSAEFNKKFALALGCLALTVVTLPLSLVKIRHGRLVGFGLSLLIAVSYWYILFASQLKIFDFSFNAGFLMYVPDAVMLATGLSLLVFNMRRAG